jgi:hypothetical protein
MEMPRLYINQHEDMCGPPLRSPPTGRRREGGAFSDEWMDKQGSERVLLFVILQLSFYIRSPLLFFQSEVKLVSANPFKISFPTGSERHKLFGDSGLFSVKGMCNNIICITVQDSWNSLARFVHFGNTFYDEERDHLGHIDAKIIIK